MMIGKHAHIRVNAENVTEFEALLAEFDIEYEVRSEDVQDTVKICHNIYI